MVASNTVLELPVLDSLKMAEEEEAVAMELEALEAVYGDDFVVIDSYPPHFHLHIKPRTADVSSQQFVEAILDIRSGRKYPEEPPTITLIDSKGLDLNRQKHLISCVQHKASELLSSLMLLALCEEAVERLSIMNHPDGDCPLCLYTLVPEDDQSKVMPFMKLMSCFHCFHSECIIRWWNWIQMEKEVGEKNLSSRAVEESNGNCPVCRKVFHAEDLVHVLNLVGAHSSQLNSDADEIEDSEMLLQSDSENTRRQKFEAVLKLQEEKGCLNEPRKSIVVVPGIYLPQPSTSTEEASEQQEVKPDSDVEINGSGSSSMPEIEINSIIAAKKSENRNKQRKKHKGRITRKPAQQWLRKDDATIG